VAMNRRGIVIVDYDPQWPSTFDAAGDKLVRLLGGGVVEISHVGSTSIPGLCAKPKIDVDVVLYAEEAIPAGIEILERSGYTFHGNKYNDGMWAFTTGRGSFGERVYLCGPGNITHQKRILFRDYLRTHPDEAAIYGELKRRLAAEASDDWDYYTSGKGPYVASIVRKAVAALNGSPEVFLRESD
jgi:GrpB-like predicted nucleotidyltransferase (UPF0157 family)